MLWKLAVHWQQARGRDSTASGRLPVCSGLNSIWLSWNGKMSAWGLPHGQLSQLGLLLVVMRYTLLVTNSY